jgi:hypothetical protein
MLSASREPLPILGVGLCPTIDIGECFPSVILPPVMAPGAAPPVVSDTTHENIYAEYDPFADGDDTVAGISALLAAKPLPSQRRLAGRSEVGATQAVARLFQRSFEKSKKDVMRDWSVPSGTLCRRALIYACRDAVLPLYMTSVATAWRAVEEKQRAAGQPLNPEVSDLKK